MSQDILPKQAISGDKNIRKIFVQSSSKVVINAPFEKIDITEWGVYALTHSGGLLEICYSRALKRFGQHSLNESTYLVGAYCLVSVTLNGFNSRGR